MTPKGPNFSTGFQVSSSRTIVSSSSNKKAKTLNWQERKKIKREQKQIEEDQQTIANVEKAIPQSNIGFKMLKQMGYTPGSALGKEGSGRAEPLSLEIRRSRAGIGKENPKMEKMRREKEKVERDRTNEEQLMVDFGYRQKELWKGRRIVVNFRKAEAALAQLENREVEEVEKKEDENGEKEEEEEEEVTEEVLASLGLLVFMYCVSLSCFSSFVEYVALPFFLCFFFYLC